MPQESRNYLSGATAVGICMSHFSGFEYRPFRTRRKPAETGRDCHVRNRKPKGDGKMMRMKFIPSFLTTIWQQEKMVDWLQYTRHQRKGRKKKEITRTTFGRTSQQFPLHDRLKRRIMLVGRKKFVWDAEVRGANKRNGLRGRMRGWSILYTDYIV